MAYSARASLALSLFRSRSWPRALLPGIIALFWSNLAANAAYDRQVTWEDMRALDLAPIFRSQYASQTNLFDPHISPSATEIVLRDADSRVSDEFQIPPTLRGPVEFWLRIYTEYTTQHVVLFDERHPEIVYEVLDFRGLAKTARNRVVYEILTKKRVAATLKAYRTSFQKLAKNPNPRHPTDTEKKILARLRPLKHRHSFQELARNLRTQTGQRDNIIKGLLAAESFFPKMEQVFSGMGIPQELTRLSLVESSFDLNAVSRVGATGVWQFMLKSALEYMVVDKGHGIDERLSPLKSTVAAAKLLKRNRRILGSWLLAVTSYNHGLRGLKKFRKISSTELAHEAARGLLDPCAKRSRLGWASRNYYAEFLAVLHAEAYRYLFYGEPPQTRLERPIVFHRISKSQTALALMARKGIPLRQFQFLNPDIRDLRRPLPKGFLIAIPGEKDDLALLIEPKPRRAGASS